MCPVVIRTHPSNFNVTWHKKSILTQIGRFRTVLHFEFTESYKMMHKAWSSMEEVPHCISSIKFQDHMGQEKSSSFSPKWGLSGLYLQSEFTYRFEIMHIAWRSVGDVPCCFSRWSINIRVTGLINLRFWPLFGISGILLQFEFTDSFESMHKALRSIEDMPLFNVINQILRSLGSTNLPFESNFKYDY